MNLVERAQLDVTKWDALVSIDPEASFFSYSWYMDAVAENWCVLVDDQYTSGIALPFTKRMGVEILYVPIFGRYSRIFGKVPRSEVDRIKKRFKVRELAVTDIFFGSESKRVHQIISDYDNRKLSSQAKRSLKKATSSGIEVTENKGYEKVLMAIKSELKDKFKGVDGERLSKLEELIKNAQKKNVLKVFEVSDGKETGGIVCLEDNRNVLYLKGACPDDLKRNGGMYLALNSAIEYAKSVKKNFDFGGSNIEGVKRFNHNLGGSDTIYYFHEVNDGPLWFKLARKIKNRG